MSELHISGTIDERGTFTPGRWHTPSPDALREIRGNAADSHRWAAEALAESGSVLARATASITSAQVCPGAARLELYALLPLPAETAAVVVLDGQREAYRRRVEPPARVMLGHGFDPVLKRGRIGVPIRIEGAKPRANAYIVPMWEAPGQPTRTLGLIDLASGGSGLAEIDLSAVPGGEGCRLSLHYFDGVRSHVLTQQVALDPRPPAPVILTPAPGATFSADGWLAMLGRLDGDGNPENLEWLLDDLSVGRGERASAPRPAAGNRTIVLRYGPARTSVDIVVSPAPLRNEPAWEPPWRARGPRYFP